MRLAIFVILWAGAVSADGERPGFDYWILSLSWSPTWCALEGDAREAPQCETDAGWTLHGLWPQYEDGWPAYCPTSARPPSRSETAAMSDIMGSGGLAWHQWRKHGTCSGLSSRDYFEASRSAYAAVARPEVLRRLTEPVRLPASVIEEAFLEANPAISADGLTVTCKAGRIAEVRICLDKSLRPRSCGADVSRDCRDPRARLDPVR